MGSVDDVFGRGASRGEKGRGKRKEGGGEEPPTEGGASSVACPCRPEQRAGVSAIVLPCAQTQRRPHRIATSVRASTQLGRSADTDLPQKLIAVTTRSANDASARGRTLPSVRERSYAFDCVSFRPASQGAVIEVKNLTKTYTLSRQQKKEMGPQFTGDTLDALEGISFMCEP